MQQLELAERLARRVHDGQVDKAGEPYVGHCDRVAAKLTNERAKTVAWLHDVLEDTEVSEADLRQQFDGETVDAVVALTNFDGESKEDYYARVRANDLARQVKHADIHDNLDPMRTARLEPAKADELRVKYGKALAAVFGNEE